MKPLNHAFSGYATTIFEVCHCQPATAAARVLGGGGCGSSNSTMCTLATTATAGSHLTYDGSTNIRIIATWFQDRFGCHM